jgi:hypothetical protein
MPNLCDECETVAHCLKHGCIPKIDFWKDYEPEPTRPAPVQEPMAFFDWYGNAHWGNEDFKEGCHRSWNAAIKYTTPPAAQRQWVGLTQQDIDIAFDDTQEGGGFDEFARAIEAKLKEKNGGVV